MTILTSDVTDIFIERSINQITNEISNFEIEIDEIEQRSEVLSPMEIFGCSLSIGMQIFRKNIMIYKLINLH